MVCAFYLVEIRYTLKMRYTFEMICVNSYQYLEWNVHLVKLCKSLVKYKVCYWHMAFFHPIAMETLFLHRYGWTISSLIKIHLYTCIHIKVFFNRPIKNKRWENTEREKDESETYIESVSQSYNIILLLIGVWSGWFYT